MPSVEQFMITTCSQTPLRTWDGNVHWEGHDALSFVPCARKPPTYSIDLQRQILCNSAGHGEDFGHMQDYEFIIRNTVCKFVACD